jgi:hypothetical protein
MSIRGLKAALSLGYLLFATVSSTQAARIDARQFTCQQARSPVIQQGAIMLTSSNTTYDRIVRYGSFCDPGYSSKLFFTPTADMARCPIGNKCVPSDELPLFNFGGNRW